MQSFELLSRNHIIWHRP